MTSQDESIIFFARASEKFEEDDEENDADAGECELGMSVNVPAFGEEA